MELSDDRVRALTEDFMEAGLSGRGWDAALDRLAGLTGSGVGELIGIGASAAVPFNIMTNMDPDFHPAFVAGGGGDPRVNPFVRAGMTAPVLKVLADQDFMSAEDYKRNGWYREFLIPWNVPHICLTTLERRDGMLIGLAVGRTRHEGHITDEQRAVFTTVAPHVRAAVRTQMALETQGGQLLTGVFEGLSLAAFVCDRHGRVQVMTPTAEALVSEGDLLLLRGRDLHVAQGGGDQALIRAIEAAAFGGAHSDTPGLSTLMVSGNGTGSPLVLDIIRMPDVAHEFRFEPRVLIVARRHGTMNRDRMAMVARVAFRLTEAEADVAIRIAIGETPAEIAEIRRASTGTVRTQLKTAMAKLGVRRQAELVGKLAGP